MNRSDAGKRGYEKTKELLDAHRAQQTQRALDAYEANPKFCVQCKTRLPYEKRRSSFCNHSCSASFYNQGAPRHGKPNSSLCSCGNEKQLHNKYCATCIENRVYQGARSFDDLKTDHSRKAWLVKNRPLHCELCGLAEWMGKPIPLDMDHIDGNSDNNLLDNLRLICPNCHAQTDTYKKANAGKNTSRQQMRRKRYKNGQTY